MRTVAVLSALFLSALPATLAAQNDTIYWTDGSKETKVQVTAFNVREVKWKSRGSTESRSSDRVADLDVQKVKDAYRRAYAAPRDQKVGTFRATADKKKDDPFVQQFGYWEAARLLLDNGEYGDGFLVLKELTDTCPDSGFLPRTFGEKCEYYISNNKKSDLKAVADKFSIEAQTQGFPEGYLLEARYYVALAKGLAEQMDAAAFKKEMDSIARAAGKGLPNVANRAKLQVANAARASGSIEEAKTAYNSIIDDAKSNGATRGAAWLGLGHAYQSAGNPADKEPYREAMMAFLRVYLDDDTAPGMKAEALYYGSQAAQKWGGADATRVSRTLRGRLLNQFPDSSWAKK